MKFISTITALVMGFSSIAAPQSSADERRRAFGLRGAYVLGQSGISAV